MFAHKHTAAADSYGGNKLVKLFFSFCSNQHIGPVKQQFSFSLCCAFSLLRLAETSNCAPARPQDEPKVQLEELLAECFTSFAGIVGGTRTFDLDLIEGNCRDVS